MLNPGVAYTLGLIGLTQITASMSVLLWATEPLLILGLALLVLKERVALRVVLASAGAICGVLLIALQADRRGSLPGIALTLSGVLACAFYTILAKRLLVDTSALPGLIVQQLGAFLIGLRDTSASTVGSFLNLIPFFGMGAGFILLGETFTVRNG